MQRIKQLVLLAGLMFLGSASHAQAPEWLFREFLDDWNAPGQGLEEFLNVTCQPSDLDGIQLIGVQKGHGEVLHLHVYCRHDKDASVHYKVSRPTEARGQVDANVQKYLGHAKVRIGPFWFGAENEDGFFLIEKLR